MPVCRKVIHANTAAQWCVKAQVAEAVQGEETIAAAFGRLLTRNDDVAVSNTVGDVERD
jgi:hypothetical protein